MTISHPIAARAARPGVVLDFAFMRRAALVLGVVLLMVTPFSTDPLAFAAGSLAPWLLVSIIGKPNMPVALIFFVLWQWAQVFARVLQCMVDGESLSSGFYGSSVAQAYWYMLSSVVVLAVAIRIVLSSLPRPTPEEERAHLSWRPSDLFVLYIATLFLAVACGFASRIIPTLGQQFEAVSRLKIVAEFLLFTTVMATGRGAKFMLAAVLFEIMIGFSGLLSDFRGVFIYLGIAAIAARIRLSAASILGGIVWFMVLITLGLFWTAVKVDYREFASGGMETQAFSVPLSERLAYLGTMAVSPGKIDWSQASYAMLSRFAYVDIFGSVIAYQEFARDTPIGGQWEAAFDHVFKPRFLFPNKRALSDTETYVRLSGANPDEVVRESTSISVGYMGENYVDFGFPGMLAGIFVLGVLIALVVRYFMRTPLPWMVRQGIVMAFVYNIAGTGVEISLPKLFGATVMYFLVYLLLVKFAAPYGLTWLQNRSGGARRQPT